MQTNNAHDLLKKCIENGFSIVSISMVTQISKDEIQTFMDNRNYRLNDKKKEDYLIVFIMELYYVRPDSDEYYRGMLNALIQYFKVSEQTIAKYIDVDINEFMSFETSQNKDKIEKYIAHLFTTFIRNPKFSE